MELALFIYIAETIGKVGGAMLAFASMSVVVAIVSQLIYRSDDCEEAKKWSKISTIFALVFYTAWTILPTEKTLYVMAGAYTAQKIAENPKAQQISDKVFKIIDQKLDELVKTTNDIRK